MYFHWPKRDGLSPTKVRIFRALFQRAEIWECFVGAEEVGFWPAAIFPLALRVARFDVSLCTLGLF